MCLVDADEQIQAFRRNDKFSASTPWGNGPTPNGESSVPRRKM